MRRASVLVILAILLLGACDSGTTADWTGTWTGTVVLAFSYEGEGGSCTRGDLAALDEPEELLADDLVAVLAQEGNDVSGTVEPFVSLGAGGCAVPRVEADLAELAESTPLVTAAAGISIPAIAEASGDTLEWGELELEQTDDGQGARGRLDFSDLGDVYQGGLVVVLRRQSPPEGEEGVERDAE